MRYTRGLMCLTTYKKPMLSQRWPRDAPYIQAIPA